MPVYEKILWKMPTYLQMRGKYPKSNIVNCDDVIKKLCNDKVFTMDFVFRKSTAALSTSNIAIFIQINIDTKNSKGFNHLPIFWHEFYKTFSRKCDTVLHTENNS